MPAQYDGSEPAALMVFQDGHSYLDENGRWRTPIVFDNLIAQGAMPITIAVFLDPGNHIDRPLPESPWRNSNRSLEYDSLGKRYARFLLEEIIPEVKKQYQISDDPRMRAICGASSGGICSFTAAWERPDQFGKVLSTIGSFVNLRGGDVYPSLIRKTEQKPIRVYLADTSGDLDNPFGHWPTANKKMASALQYMGYDVRFDWAEGFGHNADHGGALFPDALKWLWRKEAHSPVYNTKDDLKGDLTLLNLLVPGESWEVVASDLGFADGPCADADGNFYYCDMRAAEVYRIDAKDNSQKVIANESVSGIEFGPDGMLYACQGSKNRVIRIDPASGDVTEVAGDLQPNDLAVSSDGWIYITETGKGQVTRIQTTSGETNIAATGINRPNGIALSNDGGTLAVSEYGGKQAWMFRVNADDSLDAGMPIMDLRCPINDDGEFAFNQPPPYADSAQGDGMAVDKTGRYYITSSLGVQIFDPTGRPCGLLPKPNATAPLTSCILAGKDHQYLYVTNGNTIYRRRLTVD
ncbi:MAG: SMP-30/gluconolactonase/LRE family protein [Pirellulaceae bacterium]